MTHSIPVKARIDGIGRPRPNMPVEIMTTAIDGPATVVGRHILVEVDDPMTVWLVRQLASRLAGLDRIESPLARSNQEVVLGEAIDAVIDGFKGAQRVTA